MIPRFQFGVAGHATCSRFAVDIPEKPCLQLVSFVINNMKGGKHVAW
jgi:hypothetical protein